MLCQLVCADRRYQRMNCFNIRELQGILKRRFFTDLVNSSDHREILDSSMIGLRFKTNNTFNLNHDILNFYNFGTTTDLKHRYSSLHNLYSVGNLSPNYLSYYLMSDFSFTNFLNFIYSYCVNCLQLTFNFVVNFSIYNLQPTFSFSAFLQLLTLNFNFSTIVSSFAFNNSPTEVSSAVMYTSNSSISNSKESLYSNLESSSDVRYNRFSNPVISYDYKCGHYMGIWDKLFPSLMVSFIEVARGMRKAS